jgi:hypothetical protein
MKPWVQTPVLPKKKEKKQLLLSFLITNKVSLSNFCANGNFLVVLTCFTFNNMLLLSLPNIKTESCLCLAKWGILSALYYSAQRQCFLKWLVKCTWENWRFNNLPTQK